jgi:hypothetical protein
MPEEHKFSGEEAATIAKEIERLTELWNVYIAQLFDGDQALSVHTPPALASVYSVLLTDHSPLLPLLGFVRPTQRATLAAKLALANIASYGDTMFRFGQWCVAQGVKYADFTQCKCGTVSDTELFELVQKETEEKGD